MLTAQGWNAEDQEQLLTALTTDYTTAALALADRIMLDYAVKLTLHPSTISEADIAGLRAAAFDDRAIHDICAVTAYFAFVNRIADGLGVELEGDAMQTATS